MAAYAALYRKILTLFDHVPPHVINLGMGSPSDALLKGCTQVLKNATAHRMEQDDAYLLFQYGPEIGDRKYREAVSKVLSEEYRSPVDVDDIMATSGATNGLHTIAHLLFSPGDIAFVENPTYFLANTMFKDDAGLVVKGVPMDDQGVIPDALEEAIEANKTHRPRELTEKKPYWGILYILSCFQNPRGMNLPPDRCKRVVELARKHKLLVISDDVYNLLYHDKPPIRLFTYDDKSDPDYFGNVVSNGSFSKVFGPGMRLGWLEAPKRVTNTLLSSPSATSSGAFNHTASGIMTSIINLGLLQEMSRKARGAYCEQCEALSDAIREEIPQAEFIRPYGGFFMWIKLPETIDGKELLQLCKEKYDVVFCPGELTSVDGSFKNYIRLAFCHYETDVLREAAARIGQAVKELIDN